MGYSKEVRTRVAQAKDDLETQIRWQSWAACRDYDPEIFTVQTSRKANRINLEFAVGVCNTLCPVRAECLSSVELEDREWSVFGGQYPLRYKNPAKEKVKRHQARPTRQYCKADHDMYLPGGKLGNGKCKVCDDALPKKAPRSHVHKLGTKCAAGHLLDERNMRSSGQCRTCYNEQAKVRYAKKVLQAKAEADTMES